MQAPKFWDKKESKLGKILAPLGAVYAWTVAHRLKYAHPYQAGIPVICVGNISVGGTGKTPVCLALANLLRVQGKSPWFLNHGYHATKQNMLVNPKEQTALEVGDEALLLSAFAPTIVDSARARGAQLAEKKGASLLIMDDGFQNPSLVKSLSFVVVDGVKGFGNERVLPAGPLREPVLKGLKRADAVILVGNDVWGIKKYLQDKNVDVSVFTGQFVPCESDMEQLKDREVFAFAGIGNPQKFFDMLISKGIKVSKTQSFPDHYFYTRFDLEDLKKKADGRLLVTTAKDWVKIPPEMRDGLVQVKGDFIFDNPDSVWQLIKESL